MHALVEIKVCNGTIAHQTHPQQLLLGTSQPTSLTWFTSCKYSSAFWYRGGDRDCRCCLVRCCHAAVMLAAAAGAMTTLPTAKGSSSATSCGRRQQQQQQRLVTNSSCPPYPLFIRKATHTQHDHKAMLQPRYGSQGPWALEQWMLCQVPSHVLYMPLLLLLLLLLLLAAAAAAAEFTRLGPAEFTWTQAGAVAAGTLSAKGR
jgi:hypothetical protein